MMFKSTLLRFRRIQFRVWHSPRMWRFGYLYQPEISSRRAIDLGPVTIYLGGPFCP